MGAYSRSVERGDKANTPDISTVSTAYVLVRTFKKESRAMKIVNTHSSQDLLFSLDGGTTGRTIGPHGKIDEAHRAKTLMVKGGGAGTGYNIDTTEAQ